jgi:hypothetical protein
MMRHSLLLSLLSCVVLPLRAQWVATTPAAEVFVQSPRIAAALDAAMCFDQAMLAKNVPMLESLFADDAVTPAGKASIAGKQVKRRTNEVWTDASGDWQLAVRQATVYAAE